MSHYIIRSIYYTNLQSHLRYGIIFWGRANKSKNILKCKKKVIWIVSGVSKCTLCRDIFKDYNILTVGTVS
jgi:hypothetical protein